MCGVGRQREILWIVSSSMFVVVVVGSSSAPVRGFSAALEGAPTQFANDESEPALSRAFRSEFIAKASTSAWHVGVECFALAALALLSGYLLGLQHAKLQARAGKRAAVSFGTQTENTQDRDCAPDEPALEEQADNFGVAAVPANGTAGEAQGDDDSHADSAETAASEEGADCPPDAARSTAASEEGARATLTVVPAETSSSSSIVTEVQSLLEEAMQGNTKLRLKAAKLMTHMVSNQLALQQLEETKLTNRMAAQALVHTGRKAELASMSELERRRLEALRCLRAQCRDDLSAGLLVLLGCVLWSMWQSASRRVSTTSLRCAAPPPSSAFTQLWRPAFMDSADLAGCVLWEMAQVLGGVAAGFVSVVVVAYCLLRSRMLSEHTKAPVTSSLVLGLVCAAGLPVVCGSGGSWRWWVALWGVFGGVHALSTLCAGRLARALDPSMDVLFQNLETSQFPMLGAARSGVAVPAWIRSIVFHGLLSVVLPGAIGVLPFMHPQWAWPL